MRYLIVLVVGVVIGSLWRLSAIDAPPTLAPVAAAPTTQLAPGDVDYFKNRMNTDHIAHFRLRLKDEQVGERTHPGGRVEHVKTYYGVDSFAAELFVKPAEEQVAIVQDAAGRRMGMYFRNLRFDGDRALVDVNGVSVNFGFRSSHGGVSGGQSITRTGTPAEPMPSVYAPGQPAEVSFGRYGYGNVDSPMGKDYALKIHRDYTLELVGITTVGEIMKDHGRLDTHVPPPAAAEAMKDMTSTTRPSGPK